MTGEQRRILVIGATGLVGSGVARGLRENGYAVRALARSPEKAHERLGEGFEVVQGDIRDANSVASALQDCFGVHIAVSGGPTPEDYDQVEHLGTAEVARLAHEAGVNRLTYTSGTSAQPGNDYFPPTRAKLLAAKALAEGQIDYTIFRPSWFFESLAYFVRGDQAGIIGSQPNPVGWLALADYARMVAKSYSSDDVIGKTFDVAGPEKITMLDALKRYCTVFHPALKPRSVSFFMAKSLAKMTGNKALEQAIPLMEFFEKFREDADVEEVNRLLGAPTTTLEQWARRQQS